MQDIKFNHPIYPGTTLIGTLKSNYIELVDTSTNYIYFRCWVRKITTSKKGITVICFFLQVYQIFVFSSNHQTLSIMTDEQQTELMRLCYAASASLKLIFEAAKDNELEFDEVYKLSYLSSLLSIRILSLKQEHNEQTN